MKLTVKQERFVREYLVDLNATAAAKRAGYSQKTARAIGKENLTKPDIQQQLAKQLEPEAERLHQDVVLCLEMLRQVVDNIVPADPTSSQLKAIELTLRYYGLLVDRTEQRTTKDVSIRMVVSEETRDRVNSGFSKMLDVGQNVV